MLSARTVAHEVPSALKKYLRLSFHYVNSLVACSFQIPGMCRVGRENDNPLPNFQESSIK